MMKFYNYKFQKKSYEIFIGDYMATKEKDVLLSTILGPCIAVCMMDIQAGVVGMNHFMLPGCSGNNDSRYGLDCTNMLIEEMLKQGASRNRLTVKVFGGASIFGLVKPNVARSNIDFIKTYLHEKVLPIEAIDVGSYSGRRISFCSDTYAIYMQRFGNSEFTFKEISAVYS